VSAHRSSIQVCAPGAPTADDQAVEDVIRETTVAHEVSFIEPRKWLCSNGTCPVIVGNLLVYRDGHHLSNRFMTWLTPVVAEVLVPFVERIVQSATM
jgi:hypothetical protein